jgi:hypothetical protein
MKKLLLIALIVGLGHSAIANAEVISKLRVNPGYQQIATRACDLYRVNRFTEQEITEEVLARLVKVESNDPDLSLKTAISTDPQLVESSYIDAFIIVDLAKRKWNETSKCEFD